MRGRVLEKIGERHAGTLQKPGFQSCYHPRHQGSRKIIGRAFSSNRRHHQRVAGRDRSGIDLVIPSASRGIPLCQLKDNAAGSLDSARDDWIGRASLRRAITEKRDNLFGSTESDPRTCQLLAKCGICCLFPASQRVFKLITLLVPGLPSLDAKLHSPGVTQRSRNGGME